MRFYWLVLMLSVICLPSCHQNNVVKENIIGKKYNREDAASYNIQLGLAYLKQDDRSRAKRKMVLALAQAPNSSSAHASMAYFLEKSGQINEAGTYYKKAILLAPGSGAPLNNYGTFLCRHGHYQLAEEYFLKAANDIQYENSAGAYENAGLCAMAIPNTTKASMYFNKALEQDPSRTQSLVEMVRIEIKQNNLDLALSHLQKHPQLSLQNPSLLSLAADVAHKAGKLELETNYKQRLQQLSYNTGVKNEYNSNNG